MSQRPSPFDPNSAFFRRLPDGREIPEFPVVEFWRWGFSNVQENIIRGILAEFMVAKALGAPVVVRQSWDEADVVLPSGVKVEVKSSGYIQAWPQHRDSAIIFSGLRSRLWTPDGGLKPKPEYHADVYVFAIHTASSRDEYDPLNLDQWQFRVAPRAQLAARDVRSLSYAQLKKMVPAPIAYAGLADAVEEALKSAA